jgi:Domain of unknown function (DUF4124)
MNIKLLLCINLLLVSIVHAETVYKTVDAEGNTVFSDAKTDGAEVMEIKEAQSINSPAARTFKATPAKEKQKDPGYTKLVIASPKNDSTIHAGDGNISVAVTLEPALNGKDSMVLFMDGKQVLSGRAPQFSLTNIDRGTHTIDVAVISEDDKVIKRSEKIVLHLRRASRFFPNSPDISTSAQKN